MRMKMKMNISDWWQSHRTDKPNAILFIKPFIAWNTNQVINIPLRCQYGCALVQCAHCASFFPLLHVRLCALCIIITTIIIKLIFFAFIFFKFCANYVNSYFYRFVHILWMSSKWMEIMWSSGTFPSLHFVSLWMSKLKLLYW